MEHQLLFYSFQQIKGVSKIKESVYWDAGETLISLRDTQYAQQTFLTENDAGADIQQSIDAIQKEDVDFFKERLANKYYYRIAYSFPEDVMFLDIETTGLSTVYHYITCIGWILNGEYSCWLQGTSPAAFLKAFQSAKLIVTFNGIKFDCKFLDHAFQTDQFSQKPNLDLMFLCRRFGLKGGQKEIERIIGFARPKSLKETNGKEAIALWYSFLFGKKESLKQLIKYNYYDVQGMTYILDWLFFSKIYGVEFPKQGSPKCFFYKQPAPNILPFLPDASVCKDIRTYVKKSISNFSNDFLKAADKYCIIGIDLAGKVSSRTGFCVLKSNVAETRVCHNDDEILQLIEHIQPDLISIDAPLSLPKGRTSVYDDDPERETAGILRYAERELKRRNINSYPALIRSMQELTKRGIHLADVLRKKGYPVIECFPGAAQDVVQLPRKRTDESLLKTGLKNFGIKGTYIDQPVYHDELDAITASLVGKFFISGYYEPIGIPEENDMIIPQKEYRAAQHELIIGLAGPVAVGKTTVGRYLEILGFHYIRYSQVIQQELLSRGTSADRNDLRATGAVLFNDGYQYKLNKKLDLHILPFTKVIIDGVRHFEDYTYWKEKRFLNYILVYIDADYTVRKNRFARRKDENIHYAEAISHSAEAEVEALRKKADYIIANNGDIENLHASIRNILEEIEKRSDGVSK